MYGCLCIGIVPLFGGDARRIGRVATAVAARGRWFAGLGRRLRRADYPYVMAVENIGEGQRDAREIVAGWMDSREHRLNLLAPGARDVGFGVAVAATGRLNWSMVAAAAR